MCMHFAVNKNIYFQEIHHCLRHVSNIDRWLPRAVERSCYPNFKHSWAVLGTFQRVNLEKVKLKTIILIC